MAHLKKAHIIYLDKIFSPNQQKSNFLEIFCVSITGVNTVVHMQILSEEVLNYKL
jgi:hypothetical protein